MKCKVKFNKQKIERDVRRGEIKSYRSAGALIWRIARNSIKRKGNPDIPSPAGTPPFDHSDGTGFSFKKSICFSANEDGVVIGPIAGRVGALGAVHEFGLGQYPARPFMGPALEKALPKLPKTFADNITLKG